MGLLPAGRLQVRALRTCPVARQVGTSVCEEEQWAAPPALANRSMHNTEHRPEQFASLDIEAPLSLPSNAAFSLPDSGSATPAPGAAGRGGTASSLAHGVASPGSSGASQPGAVSGPNLAAAGLAAGEGSSRPLAPLPRLKLGQPLPLHHAPTAAEQATLASPRAAAARPPPLAALVAETAAGPQSPRSMHGLVRTSLLPAAADRQAVQHVGELLSADKEADAAADAGLQPRASGGLLSAATVQHQQQEAPAEQPPLPPPLDGEQPEEGGISQAGEALEEVDVGLEMEVEECVGERPHPRGKAPDLRRRMTLPGIELGRSLSLAKPPAEVPAHPPIHASRRLWAQVWQWQPTLPPCRAANRGRRVRSCCAAA